MLIGAVAGIVFTAGDGASSFTNYVHLGHGGNGSSGNHSGAITIASAQDISFQGSDQPFAYALLGHGDPAFGEPFQATGRR